MTRSWHTRCAGFIVITLGFWLQWPLTLRMFPPCSYSRVRGWLGFGLDIDQGGGGREAEMACAFDEPQDMYVRLRVDAIAAGASIRGRDQPCRCEIPNGLC